MTTYIGVEQNTDSTCERTVIIRFGQSRTRAEQWGAVDPGFAFPGAARSDISPGMQNWHHRLRNVYAMPAGYRLPRKEAERVWAKWHGSRYQGTVDDKLADLIHRDADEHLDCTPAAVAS